MNFFRLAGDICHAASIGIVMHTLLKQKNCRGISLKTQLLYLVVFVCRYLDLFYNFSSLYNSLMKIIFIGSSGAIVYVMSARPPICDTYDKKADSFNLLFLIIPCTVFALIFNEYFSPIEILWAFSIYLEAVAIVPQLIMVHDYAGKHQGFVENLTTNYVVTLGAYRALYLLNWIYRLITEEGYRNWIVWIAGLVQTAIYCDFFYYYIKAWINNKSFSLPI